MRHLQKAEGDDPPLSAAGAAQAQALASVLGGERNHGGLRDADEACDGDCDAVGRSGSA